MLCSRSPVRFITAESDKTLHASPLLFPNLSPKQVYKNFVEAVDAIDNGISQWDTTEAPKYLSNTSLGSRVGALNPKWNEDGSEEVLYRQFLKAVQLTGTEFQECVEYVGKCWLPARTHVRTALDSLSSVDPSCQVMGGPRYRPGIYLPIYPPVWCLGTSQPGSTRGWLRTSPYPTPSPPLLWPPGRYFSAWKHPRVVEDFSLPEHIEELTGQQTCPFGDAVLRLKDALLAGEEVKHRVGEATLK
jgi:hypothetical protein